MKTYYNDTLRKVTFENKSIDLIDAKDYFKALSDDSKSYIGFLDVHDEVVIFKWLEKDKWLIDHPVVPDTLHRQRYVTKEECLAFIEKIYQEYDISGFEGFEDVPIQNFTLDEILEFKEEDGYLLREEEPPVKKVDSYRSVVSKVKKTKKPSIILGDISIPKEERKLKSTPRVTAKKKSSISTSPLKRFKTSAEELKTEKQKPSTAKTIVKPAEKKPTKDKTSRTNLLHLGKTTKPKKENKSSLVMGEQLGTNKKSTTTPTPSKPKNNSSSSKKPRPSDDNSFFSI
ncbi:hypothetical protein D1818_04690 [Aquimarina sp. BL5]|uniref:hypothetical protein n=1 Tax=Aquimarina sp. BL5 TaxID=1714860 RepID=UPI000E4CCFA7|nr:hypothetical protein [Aquimarina sp. BL5]AXT50161.1 hypothetical protein D1818_04690 [Aquimarina sp. BL5]RKN02069.1 hypothetical protein D7036_16925 [Aquimarina sp. BL5]